MNAFYRCSFMLLWLAGFLYPVVSCAQDAPMIQPKPISPKMQAINKVTSCIEGVMGKQEFAKAQAQLMGEVLFKAPVLKSLCASQKYDEAKAMIIQSSQKPYAVKLLEAQKHCTNEIEALRHDPSMQKTREQIGSLANFNGDFAKLDMREHCGLLTPKGTNHGI